MDGYHPGCAQCHNHKFDPFTQKEYYQLLAFFNNTQDGGRSVAPTLAVPLTVHAARLKELQTRIADGSAVLGWLPAPGRAVLAGPMQQRLARLRRQMQVMKPTSTLVMKELPKPRPTHVMLRGNHKNLGERVQPGVPARLHPWRPARPRNRLGLARWLVDPDNPLVGRVTVNRIWARYFGRGFVETSEEFGAQGELPTHPELLDWLAVEFREEQATAFTPAVRGVSRRCTG